MTQLVLPLKLDRELTLNSFYPGENQEVLGIIQSCIQKKEAGLIYLFGQNGSGKTHLLQALCHYEAQESQSVFYFSFRHLNQFPPQIIDNLEACDLICLDDVDQLAQNPQWEEALFHCFNRLSIAKKMLIIAGAQPVQELNLALPDLSSRLASGITLQMKLLSDEDRLQALMNRAHRRQMKFPLIVAKFLLSHYPRDMHSLMQALDKLDQASLIEQKKMTIPFAKKVLDLNA